VLLSQRCSIIRVEAAAAGAAIDGWCRLSKLVQQREFEFGVILLFKLWIEFKPLRVQFRKLFRVKLSQFFLSIRQFWQLQQSESVHPNAFWVEQYLCLIGHDLNERCEWG